MENVDPLALNQVLIDCYSSLEGRLYEVLTFIYFKIFTEFNKKWMEKKPTIMEFNQFLDNVYGTSFKNKIGGLVEDFLKQSLI
jgi:hypothetical protein